MLRAHGICDSRLSWRLWVYWRELIGRLVHRDNEVFRHREEWAVLSTEVGLFKTRDLSARVSFDDERGATFSIHLPFLFYIYLSLPWLRIRAFDDRQCGVCLTVWDRYNEDGPVLRVDPWVDGNWSRSRSWIRNGWSVRPLVLVFGPTRCSKQIVFADDMPLPLPEGVIPGTVEVTLYTWKRARWPWWPGVERGVYACITPSKPVVVPGKGENSWDCDDDSVHEMSVQIPGVSFEDAQRAPLAVAHLGVEKFLDSVAKTRRER